MSMTAQDFFYFAFGIGFLVMTGFISFAVYKLSKSLDELTSILTKVDDITTDANELKNIVKNGMIYMKNLVFRKGGDKSDRKQKTG